MQGKIYWYPINYNYHISNLVANFRTINNGEVTKPYINRMADFYKNAQWPEFSQKIFSCTRFYCIFSKNLRLYTIFFAIKNDRTIYIQSAYILTDEDTIRREYSPLEAINDNYKKIVVSLDDLKLPSKEGIIHIQAWDLLSHLQ